MVVSGQEKCLQDRLSQRYHSLSPITLLPENEPGRGLKHKCCLIPGFFQFLGIHVPSLPYPVFSVSDRIPPGYRNLGLCYYSLHIIPVPLHSLDDMVPARSSSSLVFCFHTFSSQELQVSLRRFVLRLQKCYCSACTWLEIFHVVVSLTPLVRLCYGGNLEVTQMWGNLTYQTAERSPLSSSASIPKLAERLKSNTRKVLLGLKWSHGEKLRLSDGTKGHIQA